MNEWLKLFLHKFKPPNRAGNPQNFDLESITTIITTTTKKKIVPALYITNSFSTKSVLYWPVSHFHAAYFLALSCRFSSRSHSFSFWRLWFLAIWSPSLFLVWRYHIAGPLVETGLVCETAWWLSVLVVFCLLTCEVGQHTVGLMLKLTYN